MIVRCTILIFVTMLTMNKEVIPQNVEEEVCCCNFCDGHELTTKEKYEELLWKALTDEKNYLEDGIITKEVYELQIEPFNKALDYLEEENLEEEKVSEMYYELLQANLDWLAEDEAAGEEIDEGFRTYIENEIAAYECEE